MASFNRWLLIIIILILAFIVPWLLIDYLFVESPFHSDGGAEAV